MVDIASAGEVSRAPARGPGRLAMPARLRRAAAPLLWLGPAIALIAVVVLWPVYVMFDTSFKTFSPDGFLLGPAGWRNFSELFAEPGLSGILARTVIWVVAVVGVTMLVSLGLA